MNKIHSPLKIAKMVGFEILASEKMISNKFSDRKILKFPNCAIITLVAGNVGFMGDLIMPKKVSDILLLFPYLTRYQFLNTFTITDVE